jgi:hypothetical protein
MAPPLWLKIYWDSEPSWIKRYIQSSEINAIMCKNNIFKREHTMWTNENIKKFNNFMNKNYTEISKPIKLYRGSWYISPTFSPFLENIKNCQYISTSKSKAIASEFTGQRGYLHIFHLEPGVKIYDLQHDYGDNLIKREKEVLIYPKMKLTLISYKNNILNWKVNV